MYSRYAATAPETAAGCNERVRGLDEHDESVVCINGLLGWALPECRATQTESIEDLLNFVACINEIVATTRSNTELQAPLECRGFS